jgi:hypothetical protein
MILYDVLKDQEPSWKRLPNYVECRKCYFEQGEPGGPLARGPMIEVVPEILESINIPSDEAGRTRFALVYALECGHKVAH